MSREEHTHVTAQQEWPAVRKPKERPEVMPATHEHIVLPLLQVLGSPSGRWHSYTTIPDPLNGLKVASPFPSTAF